MSSFCLCYIPLSYFGVHLLKNGADRHHNPARLTTASNHLWGSLRQWRDFTMIGVCSFLSFRCGNLAGCEQYVFAKQALPSMRCKYIQKFSIIATFSCILMCFKMKFA